MHNIRLDPIDDATVWTGASLEGNRDWEYTLNNQDRSELASALAGVRRGQLRLENISKTDFLLPNLETRLAEISNELRTGRGFVLLRGFPVNEYSYEDLELMYWGLCSHIGLGLTQNGDATFIHYVTDGKRRPSQGRRGVGFPREAPLHIDLTDVVSLLCVRQAPDNPPSWVASSMNAYNGLLRRQPKALERLYEGFEWDRMDEHGRGETPTSGYKVPVFSQKDGVVSCQYNRNWIENAANRRGTPLLVTEIAILDLLDEIAFEARLEFPFTEGDIQFCTNYTVMHGRAAHSVVDEEERKRVLMRIWLDMPGKIRPFVDDALIRYGNGRHGQIGWSPQEMLSGLNTLPRARRPDGTIGHV